MSNKAIYAGTFDPITLGHLDIIRRASRITNQLVIGVARHTGKTMAFSLDQRIALIEETIKAEKMQNISIKPIEGLLVDFVRDEGAKMLIRGLRAVADFDYEFQMAMMNARLAPDVDTVFLMASEKHQFIASRIVKEVAKLGGDVSSFVPPVVLTALDKMLEPIA